MKNYIILIFGLISTLGAAQKNVSKTINTAGADIIHMSLQYADIEITNWDGKTVEVTGNVNIQMGEYNDNYKLTLEKKGGNIELVSTVENEDKIPYTVLAYDEEGNIVYRGVSKKTMDWKDMKKENINVEHAYVNYSRDIQVQLNIKVPRGMKIKAETKFGDVAIKEAASEMEIYSKHGSIEAVYADGSKIANTKLESKHDWVDVTLPKSSKVSVRLQSNFGELMTDIPLEVDKSKSSSGSYEEVIYANVNGGGPLLSLKAKHDNVYLRQGK